MIVVGSVGMSGARRFVAGSVPNNISHHAPTSVLIVNTAWAKRALAKDLDASARSYEAVLIASDGSETASRAVGIGAEIAGAAGARVLLLHVGDEEASRSILEGERERLGDELQVRALSQPTRGDDRRGRRA